MNRDVAKLVQAQNKTVSLEGLAHKMQAKYIKYFEKKIAQQAKAKGLQLDNQTEMSFISNMSKPVVEEGIKNKKLG